MTASRLRPSLVLGSGFHRHVFGDDGPVSARPLYDWQQLVSEVAAAMQVAAPSRAMPPVQRWGTLLLRAAKEGFQDPAGKWHAPATTATYKIEAMARRHVVGMIKKASENHPLSARVRTPLLPQWGTVIPLNFDVPWLNAAGQQHAWPALDGTTTSTHVIEALARQHVVDVIQKACDNYPPSARARIPLLPQWGAVISLNFDTAWLGAAGQRSLPARDSAAVGQSHTVHITTREPKRLFKRIDVDSEDGSRSGAQRVWFPIGHVNDQASIRMGLHDFGAAPFTIQRAFDLLKQWERANFTENAKPGSCEQFAAIGQALDQQPTHAGSDMRGTPLPCL